MGVLHVNVGDAVTPDWREIGCGGSATGPDWIAYQTYTVPTAAGLRSITFASPITLVPGVDYWYVMQNNAANAQAQGTTDASDTFTNISVSAGMFYSNSGGGFGSSSSVLFPIFGTTASSGTAPQLGYSGGPSNYWGPTSIAQKFRVTSTVTVTGLTQYWGGNAGLTGKWGIARSLSATSGRLKLWDGTRWMREVCTGDPTGGIVDNFNRADGATLLPNRSDGGLWTVGSSSDMQIFSNRLGRPTSGIGSGSIAIWADYGYASTVSVQFDFARTGFAALYAHIAIDVSGSQGYEVQFYPFDGGYIIIKNSGGTVIVNQLIGNSWTDGTARTAVITFNYSTGVITVAVAGTTYVTYTDTGTLPTATGLTLFPGGSYSGDGMYFDNVSVAGTGAPERHPLKMWDGTTWQTVTCMTPA